MVEQGSVRAGERDVDVVEETWQSVGEQADVTLGSSSSEARAEDAGQRSRGNACQETRGVDHTAGAGRCRRERTDYAVQRVGDINFTVRSHGDAARKVEERRGRVAAIAAISDAAFAGDGKDVAVGCDFADARVVRVGDINIAGGIPCDSDWIVELSIHRRSAVSAGTEVSVARQVAQAPVSE